ncbi:hypothetical protein [Pseudosulfitobacter sp. DSM 107133]|nr:hypothetical protein [Pseudosulfitobacter sp. DSM 107133]UOA27026.1 hypothetical protein DSM107133_01736 [Pseudosulfitobacter sp. DSM 107133]
MSLPFQDARFYARISDRSPEHRQRIRISADLRLWDTAFKQDA